MDGMQAGNFRSAEVELACRDLAGRRLAVGEVGTAKTHVGGFVTKWVE